MPKYEVEVEVVMNSHILVEVEANDKESARDAAIKEVQKYSDDDILTNASWDFSASDAAEVDDATA